MRTLNSEVQLNNYIENIGEELEKQEQEWENEINEIIETLGINHYPTFQEFKSCGKEYLYTTIRSYMGHDLMSDRMGLMDKTSTGMANRVFDVMLKSHRNYYPEESVFRKVSNSLYEKIALKYGHEEFRKKLKLLTKAEYEALHKRK